MIKTHNRNIKNFLAFISPIALIAGMAFAASGKTVKTITNRGNTHTNIIVTGTNHLDHLHDEITRRFISTSKKLDKFLGGRQADDESQTSLLRLSLKTGHSWEGFKFSPNARVRAALPRTKQRLQIFIDHVDADNSPLSSQDIPLTMRNSKSSTEAGLRLFSKGTRAAMRYMDIGVDLPKDPFIRFTLSTTGEAGKWTLQPLAQASWQLDEGIGVKATLETKRSLQYRLWFCTYSEFTDYSKYDGIQFIQNVYFPWRRTAKTVLTPKVELDCDTSYAGTVHTAWFTVNYRRLVYKDWLFIEIEPGVQAPQEKDYGIHPVINFKVEGYFGSSPDYRSDSLYGGNMH